MIYTGYFARIKDYDGTCISIAGKTPDGINCEKYLKFAPSKSLVYDYKSGEIGAFAYIDRYQKEVLDKLDKQEVHDYLTSFDEDIILLCYEPSNIFCHRHIVADWIESELGLKVEEYPIVEPAINCNRA